MKKTPILKIVHQDYFNKNVQHFYFSSNKDEVKALESIFNSDLLHDLKDIFSHFESTLQNSFNEDKESVELRDEIFTWLYRDYLYDCVIQISYLQSIHKNKNDVIKNLLLSYAHQKFLFASITVDLIGKGKPISEIVKRIERKHPAELPENALTTLQIQEVKKLNHSGISFKESCRTIAMKHFKKHPPFESFETNMRSHFKRKGIEIIRGKPGRPKKG